MEILLVEDNPADVRLTQEAFKLAGRVWNTLHIEDNTADARLMAEALKRDDGKSWNKLHHVADGVEALAFLAGEEPYVGAPLPDIILLDLNLPRKDGREVLATIKANRRLASIPVIVLTTSQAEEDVLKSYNLHANCYIVKPFDLDEFTAIVKSIEDFWLRIVKLPPSAGAAWRA
ncbi:MAG TPA: response regulator [Dehalococcoidia bacterium]|nr:response regulator [Dehalococcoidia bacterium]